MQPIIAETWVCNSLIHCVSVIVDELALLRERPFGSRLSSLRMTIYKRSTSMNSEKYIGLDVHQATISVAVMDSKGKVHEQAR
jgi:hypothetical protein